MGFQISGLGCKVQDVGFSLKLEEPKIPTPAPRQLATPFATSGDVILLCLRDPKLRNLEGHRRRDVFRDF